MTRLLCLCLLLLLGACASKKVEERIAHPQLRDLFPPVEASPHPAAAGEAPAAARATTAASGEATAAAGATASSAAGAAAAASAQPQAPVAAQAADKSLTFSPATLDAPTSAQPSAATPAAATAVAAAAPAPAAAAAVAAGPTWPRAITAGGVAFEIYEPQLQSWDGSTLTADAVVTAQPSGEPQPAAGAVRVVARTQVDRAAGQVSLEDIRLTQARFQASPEQSEQWLALLRTAAPRQMTRVSLARLEQGAALMRARESARTPALPGNPRIVLARNPVAVVNIDGEPRLVNVSGTKLQGVINTQALLLKDEAGKFYLRVYDGWMSAPTLRGPWSVAKAPAGAAVAEDMAKASGVVDFLQGKPDPKTGALPSLGKQIPNVVVTTQLSVVVGVNGEAKWAAIPGTKLQYVTNTTANVFRDTAAKRLYVLARGRWFQGTATGTGTWELVPATKLPADLGRIPSGHPKAGIRAYLQESPEEGLEALSDTPVIKAVSRKDARFNVTLDGSPNFKPIAGTRLNYVSNASAPIIQVNANLYYGVQNGVWFRSQSPTGPWTLADDVPPEIYAIPPSSPVYRAVNSRVYSSSTDKVYYGYAPNYGTGGANYGAAGVSSGDAAGGDVHFGYGWGWRGWGWQYY